MTEEAFTRGRVLRLLTMTREEALASGSAGAWRIAQSTRRALIGDKAAAASARPIRLHAIGPASRRTRRELRSRWHVSVEEIATAASSAMAS